MNHLADLVVSNLFGIVASVIASVLGYVVVRILRGIRASTDRTEEHAKDTADKLSGALDRISTATYKSDLEQRVEAIADQRSDSLAWQANSDRHMRETDRRVDETNDRVDELERRLDILGRLVYERDEPSTSPTELVTTIEGEPND